MPREIDRAELLEIIGSLRREVLSVSGDVRAVLEENRKLKDELDRIRERRRARRREAACSGSMPSDKSAWMKKMMMFMLMAELV